MSVLYLPSITSLTRSQSRPHFFAENLFDVLYNWLSFGKAALGWWGEDSLGTPRDRATWRPTALSHSHTCDIHSHVLSSTSYPLSFTFPIPPLTLSLLPFPLPPVRRLSGGAEAA